ncbi:SPW repeat protein [Microvirga thermotolerans]|uniref:SPW repeat-containing integral membrane domain-containing protein n=1 Tax=Microvirga thermotolerans TaxID=2651334 RepID=A0A5P9JQK5_9HYPH|nr:SPW repeat protein [Microvirga thermotolerans]QFU15042.1 hypothetical protein GDR74_01750 [Microvirga thermotolerans]
MIGLKHSSELTAANVLGAVLGALLIVSPWLLGFSGEATALWSACVTGLLIGIAALAALVDLREWESWTALVLGLWAAAAPWVLGFSGVSAAMGVHVLVGLAVAALAAFELWMLRGREKNLAS